MRTGRFRVGFGRRRLGSKTVLALGAGVTLSLTGCSGSTTGPAPAPQGAEASGPSTATAQPAVTGNACPQAFDASEADFYPIQPSFSAGYTMAFQKLNSTTSHWAYVVSGDYPYSNWMAWYLYTSKGVPLVKLSDTTIKPDPGATNPYVSGQPILATKRSYHIYFMPSGTPASVVSTMQAQGKNVAVLPSSSTTPAVSIVSRSYWSLSNDGLGNYDRFGYHGPTNTPTPTLAAYLTDSSTGELTSTPAGDCGAQSDIPKRVWYNAATNSPIVTFKDAPVPTSQELEDIPHFLVQSGSGGGSFGTEFPPAPVVNEVQFYRNPAAHAPFADVQSAPPEGNPPDACGGYVMANLPNDVVSLVHIPQLPTFPNYRGATSSTENNSTAYQVQFYSVVIYGATKQIDAVGSVNNSQIGNSQIKVDKDGGATVVLYPQSATQQQIQQIDSVVKANGWNILRSGIQTAVAPNLLVIREKGQNKNWTHALSANAVTQGAPCPQSTNSTLPLPQDPPSAQVTQFNGMGLTAPQGENCSIADFVSGKCLAMFGEQLHKTGAKWSAKSATAPTQIVPTASPSP